MGIQFYDQYGRPLDPQGNVVRPQPAPAPAPSSGGGGGGSGLAMPVANPGSRGQDMRYYLGNLQRLPNGNYTDGVYEYDPNGLSLNRPNQPVSGLPPADESERWDVWRAPEGASPGSTSDGAAPPPGPSIPAPPKDDYAPRVPPTRQSQVPAFEEVRPFLARLAALRLSPALAGQLPGVQPQAVGLLNRELTRPRAPDVVPAQVRDLVQSRVPPGIPQGARVVSNPKLGQIVVKDGRLIGTVKGGKFRKTRVRRD